MPNDRQMDLNDLLKPEGSGEEGAEVERLGWPTKEEAERYIGRPVHALHETPGNRSAGGIQFTIGPEHNGRITNVEELSPGFFVLVAEFIIDDQEGKDRWHTHHTIYRDDLESSFAIGERPSPPPAVVRKKPKLAPIKPDAPLLPPQVQVGSVSAPATERSPFVRRAPELVEAEAAPGEQETSPLVRQIQELGKNALITPEELRPITVAVEQLVADLKERSGGTMERKTIADAREGIKTKWEPKLKTPLSEEAFTMLNRTFGALNAARGRKLAQTKEEQAEIVKELSRLSSMVFALFTAEVGH